MYLNKNLTEEELMSVNCSSEINRKAMIRAGMEKRRNMEAAGKSIFVLERICMDNLVHRTVSSIIAVSEKKEYLVEFFHEHYFSDIEFKKNGHTETIDTDMGRSRFVITDIAFV